MPATPSIRYRIRIQERQAAMAHRSVRSLCAVGALSLVVTGCGGGSNVSNASPRIENVPPQAVAGGQTFTLNLANYVTDREGATLTYSVSSGGGSVAGSTYSNTFDTMGEYDVTFTVTDGQKTNTGTFRVRVTSADFVVVREDNSGLLLLDAATQAFVRVSGASGTPSFATGLADGRLVYHMAGTPGQQLWVFDPLQRVATRLAATASGDAVYRAKTSDGRIVYTTGSGDAQRLYVYNPRTGVVRDIAQDVLSTVTVAVNADDLVFYEAGVNGQADVFAYDPDADEIFVVGSAATDEQIQAVLPNGGVVFSRVGAGGERDLFYYRVGTGLVEIASDVSAIATHDKVYGGFGTSSQVVFAAQSGAVSDVYSWNPSNGQTTSISAAFTAGAYDLYAAIGAGNEVVIQRVVSSTRTDALFYDLDSGVSATVRSSTDISQVLGVTNSSTTAWAIVRPSGTPSSMLAVSLVSSPSTQTWAAGGTTSTTVGTLTNGDVVAQRQDGTALNIFDVSAGTWGTAITGTGLVFAGDGLDEGDFVFGVTASSQTDLSMWDASAGSAVVVSNTTGNDVFQARTGQGTILFTRVVSGNSNADLFSWNGTTATRLTNADSAGLLHDHTVLGQFSGTR
jgi:hypothetical protein